jgi:hypothetical protein
MQQAEGDLRVFYRITRSNPPTLRDFLSNVAKRRRPHRTDPETLRLWAGISVFDTEESAHDQALRVPAIGGYIAAIRFRASDPVQCERTGRDPHHHTLWADAVYLLEHVISVVPV